MSEVSRTLYVKLASGFCNAATDNTMATTTLENCTMSRASAGVYTAVLATGMGGQSAINDSSQARSKITVRTASRIASVTYGTDDSPTKHPTQVHFAAVSDAGVAADADFEFEIGVIIPQ